MIHVFKPWSPFFVQWVTLPPATGEPPEHLNSRILASANDNVVPLNGGKSGPHFPSFRAQSTDGVVFSWFYWFQSYSCAVNWLSKSFPVSTHHCVPAHRRNSSRSSETAGGFWIQGEGCQSYPPSPLPTVATCHGLVGFSFVSLWDKCLVTKESLNSYTGLHGHSLPGNCPEKSQMQGGCVTFI